MKKKKKKDGEDEEGGNVWELGENGLCVCVHCGRHYGPGGEAWPTFLFFSPMLLYRRLLLVLGGTVGRSVLPGWEDIAIGEKSVLKEMLHLKK